MENSNRGRQNQKNENRRKKRASLGRNTRIREIQDSDSSVEKTAKKPKTTKRKAQNVSGPKSHSEELIAVRGQSLLTNTSAISNNP